MGNEGQPFVIGAMATEILVDPAQFAGAFAGQPALLFDNVLAPNLLQTIMTRASSANYVDDDVEHIGTRAIEAPQHVGGMISLLLARPVLLDWLAQATGMEPLATVKGGLVQTRGNGRDALDWHDDLIDTRRRIAVVINLSTENYDGGLFELRHVGEATPILSYRHQTPGSMMLFAVRRDLEHRVTPILSGGPRRVFAGWFMA